MNSRLVDELRLMVFPTLLGRGKRLFAERAETTNLRLVGSRPIGPDDVVLSIYEPQQRAT